MIIDVSSDCGFSANQLKAAGVTTVIRYYSRDTIRPKKRLSADEAKRHAAAGIKIAIVYEGRFGNKAENFDYECGFEDAKYSIEYGRDIIKQPSGSTIYYAVDFDATAAEIKERIIPYFQGIRDAHEHGQPYTIGVYGSGASCKAVLDEGLERISSFLQVRSMGSKTKHAIHRCGDQL